MVREPYMDARMVRVRDALLAAATGALLLYAATTAARGAAKVMQPGTAASACADRAPATERRCRGDMGPRAGE